MVPPSREDPAGVPAYREGPGIPIPRLQATASGEATGLNRQVSEPRALLAIHVVIGNGAQIERGEGEVGFPGEVKKEEFPGTMRNMLAGNSFPQICVVSEIHSEEIRVT